MSNALASARNQPDASHANLECQLFKRPKFSSPRSRENAFPKMVHFYCPGLSMFPGQDNKKLTFLCFYVFSELFPNTWPALSFKGQSPTTIKAVAHALTILWQLFVRDCPLNQSLTKSFSHFFQERREHHLSRPIKYIIEYYLSTTVESAPLVARLGSFVYRLRKP